MIRAFWKSKLAVGAVMVVCLGLAVAVWLPAVTADASKA